MSLISCLTLILLLLPLLLPYVSSQNNVNVSVGETLVAGDGGSQWLSPSGEFALGFHKLENDLFLVAIWYHKIPAKTVIWYANGDNPAPKGSKLDLNEYSGLVLSSPQDNAELWRSQSISGSVSYGLMNDTGNFQLLDKNSQVLWDTFTRPTDTLVPTQIMELKGTLSSRQKDTNFSLGRFQFRLLEDGNAVLNPINLPTNYTYEAYYISGTRDANNATNSGYRVVFDESGYLYIVRRSGERVEITSSNNVLSTDSYYYRATINYDGVFTVSYHPKNPSANQTWIVVKTIPDNICTGITGKAGGSGVCGFNSICTLKTDQRPICTCPEGYSLLDSTDQFGACKPNLELGCGQEDVAYFMKELPNTDWPESDYEMYKPYNLEECQTACLQDCLCVASIFGEGACWKKKLPLSNGRQDRAVNRFAFLKLKNNDVSSASPQNPVIEVKRYKKDQDTLITVISVLLGSSVFVNFMLFSAVCVGFFFYYNKKRSSTDKTVANSNLRSFTFGELVQATGNFKEELGRGSCSVVFKGILTDSSAIAVKRLDKVLEDSDKEFKTEVNVIGQTHHRNLVRLLGYCDEGQHRILVYELLSNGTLASFLFGDFKPNWNQRVHIAFGIARGLLYLHDECCTQIIHCDIKPQNILLDDYYNARISDFGLSKLLMMNQSRTETGIRGTKGYVAPDWFRSAPITVKVDVYSFGVLLLEIICCRRNVNAEVGNEERVILTDWAYDCYRDGRIDMLVDNDDEAINDMKRLERFVMVAIWCLQEDPSLRPTMKKVMLMLEGIAPITIPPSPCPFTSISVVSSTAN